MTRKAPPYVKFYADDWLAGTFELSAEARGCYITLCALMWSKAGPIVDDGRSLARYCNVSTRKWPSIKNELIEAGKIAVKDGLIHQKRALDELAKSTLSSDKQREKSRLRHFKNAENSTKPLKKANSDLAADVPNQNQNHIISKESGFTSQASQREPYLLEPSVACDADAPPATGALDDAFPALDKLARNGGGRIYPEPFERFYAAFPCRPTQTKAKAYGKWRKAAKTRDPEQLVLDAQAYRAFCEHQDHPAKLVETWVNGEGWDASLEARTRSPPTVGDVDAAIMETLRRKENGQRNGSPGDLHPGDEPARPPQRRS
jgi:uncharacterized protein YdaU (DUF1376 family)